MNDSDLDRLIARANPFGDATVGQLPIDDAGSELLEEILTTTAPAPELKPLRRRRTPFVIAAAAAVAIAVAVTGALFPRGNPAAPPPAFAAEAIAVAEANQRLLIDDPNWKVTSVGAFSPESGMTRFSNGKLHLEIDWRPAKEYQLYYTDRARDPHEPIVVVGQPSTLFKISKTDFDMMMPVSGPNFVEIRAELGSEQAYREVLGKLRKVDVTTWLNAMPETVVKPAQTHATVDQMLADMALPAGFDKEPLYKKNAMDRYYLGADVSGAVGCAWLNQWITAKKAGDQAKMREAVAATQGSHSWKVLKEMEAQGAYPMVFWQVVDTIAKNQDPSAEMRGIGC